MKPDSSQLEHWRRDHVTAYIMERLTEQFRPLRPSQIAKSWEEQNRMAGNAQVLEAIDKISKGE